MPITDPDLHRRLHRRLVFADLLLLTLAAAAVVRLVGFAFFPGFTAFATLPVSEDHTRHACFSAYYLAVDRAARGEPVYPPEAYTQAEGAIGGIPVESVNVDAFVYPPLFLPTMEPFAGLDFGLARGLWMLANLLVLGACLWSVVRWVGGTPGASLLRWIPTLLLTMSVQSQLQFGNAHLLVVAAALWGMERIERGRVVSGGALLAWSIGAKLFPGVLVVYLLARRRWAAIGWTAAWGAALVGATVVMYGMAPIGEFVTYHVPRLSSGEAFGWMFEKAEAAAINVSPYGIPVKLAALGVIDDPRPAARVINGIWLVGVLVVSWVAGRRAQDDDSPLSRLGAIQLAALLLVLGSLQTPFYDAFRANAVLFVGVWLVAPALPRKWTFVLLFGELLFLPLMAALGPLWARAAMGVAGQVLAVVVGVLLWQRGSRARGEGAPPPRSPWPGLARWVGHRAGMS